MNILIIAPRYTDTQGLYYEFPLGLAYISAVLKRDGHNVFCLNLNHRQDDNRTAIISEIEKNDIKIVCSGGLSVHFNRIKAIFDIVKEHNPDIVTIAGGGLISSEPELIFDQLGIDYGVLNEGEETISELVPAIISGGSVSGIKGIVYRNGSKIKKNPARESIKDIDTIPFPDYDGFGVMEYLNGQLPADCYYMYPMDNPRILPVISTRSCPYSCTFCYHPLGKKYRKNSLDYFFRWVEELIEKYDINMLVILDELFSVNKKRMLEFAKRMKKYNLKWLAQMRVDDVDEESLTKLKESGLFYISFGIESASDTVLKSMQKKLKIAETEKALATARKLGIGIQGNLIFGDTAETQETFQESMNWWRSHKFYQINLGLIEPYPGTPVYQKVAAEGRLKDKMAFINNGCPPFNLTSMTDEEYTEMTRIIWEESQDARIFAKVNHSIKTGEAKNKGSLYEFQVVCPHCGETVTYRNMHKNEGGIFKLGCKNCNQRFDLNPIDIFTEEYADIQDIIKFLRDSMENRTPLAVIPCIPEVKFVYAFKHLIGTEIEKLNFRYFLDSDKAKIGLEYYGKNITDYGDESVIPKLIQEGVTFVIPPTRFKTVGESIFRQLCEAGVSKDRIVIMRGL